MLSHLHIAGTGIVSYLYDDVVLGIMVIRYVVSSLFS
jgi:hypothetical protein